MRRGEQILRWRGTDGRTLEAVTILHEPGGVRVRSQYLDAGPKPFSVRYDWILNGNWETRSLSVYMTQDAQRDLAIERVDAASWRVDGSVRSDLDGCEEVDLSITPFCNTLALRRFRSASGLSGNLTALYVSFPDLVCSSSRQRYEQIDEETFKYFDLGAHQGFQARLSIDSNGFVRSYEGLFELIEP